MWGYLEDASHYHGFADKIHIPTSEAELLALLREATAARIPVTIAGGGSGLTGGRVPEGGWSISLEKFNQIRVEEGKATCGAGAILRDVHAAAKRSGQFYPPDPTETMAAIGGTISCNASGSRSFLYGSTKRWVDRLRFALMDGTVYDVRRGEPIPFEVPEVHRPQARKHSAGYPLAPGMDWIDLISGSEGTLAVVIEAELKLLPAPSRLLNGIIFFPTDENALNAVEDWRAVPGLRMLEYGDEPSLNLVRDKYTEIPAEAKAFVIIEQILSSEADLDAWEDRLTTHHAFAEASWFGETDADRERFRQFRHTFPERTLDLVRQLGFPKFGSDFAVPIAKNREMLAFYRSEIAALWDAPFCIYGHIGDAHVHVNLFSPSEAHVPRGKELMASFARKSVELGGTVAAEHGLGKRKRDFLPIQYNEAEIAAMREVKLRLDPHWLLGRGNLFPPEFAPVFTAAPEPAAVNL
ncbi:MAG: FAD-binding oxidoreductase [Bryobacter sp.]|nr:FAD-binding oxidoreductase [Bryobacter sp.]